MEISEQYYTHRLPSSYRGLQALQRDVEKRYPSSVVNNWLSSQNTYTLHKDVKRRFPRRRYLVAHIDEQFQADLVDLKQYGRANRGIRYLLCVIDVFSKFAYVEPIKTKSGEHVKEAFEKIFAKAVPKVVYSDRGLEFMDKRVQELFRQLHIQHILARQFVKAAVVERFQRTLQNKIFRVMTTRKTRRYVDVLPALVEGYNNSYHTSIRMAPSAVSEHNSAHVFRTLYGASTKSDFLARGRSSQKSLQVGDKVRVPRRHGAFTKGYALKWSDELYTIAQVIPGERLMYRIVDGEGSELPTRFYAEQVQIVRNS